MNIEELLDLLEETLEDAATLPFTGGKRMVDVDKVRAVSYTHLDVYQRQVYNSSSVYREEGKGLSTMTISRS